VQILVVVANTKEKRLRVEVEKGSTRTAIGRGSIDPEPRINFGKGAIGRGSKGLRPSRSAPGGEREAGRHSRIVRGVGGDAKDLGEADLGPGKSFLFFLTGADDPGIASRGEGAGGSAARAPRPSGRPERRGRPLKIRANPKRLARTVVPISASGLQGEKPLTK